MNVVTYEELFQLLLVLISFAGFSDHKKEVTALLPQNAVTSFEELMFWG
ncbi:MAG: hypothetical protein ACI3WQ_10825 [Faecousia sp.]